MLKFKKLPGAADLSGQKYEFKMASLMYLRGLNRAEAFCMGSNVAGAGAFDDLVFKYKLSGEREFRASFVQFKHNAKGNQLIGLENLYDVKHNYFLNKYYKSWCEVKKNVLIPEYQQSGLFDVDFSQCEFAIFTNANINRSLTAASQTREHIFVTNNDRQPTVLNDSIKDKIKLGIERQMKENKSGKLLQDFYDVIDSKPMKDFLGNLQWFTGQAKEHELDALIQEEIKMALETNEVDTIKMAEMFVSKMQSWWEEKGESEVLTETAQLWSDVIASRHDLMNDSKRKEMEALNISFTDQEIDSFNQSLSSTVVINVTSPHLRLTSVKISQMLEKYHKERYIFITLSSLLSRKQEVLRAWQSVWCDVLVIECSTDAMSLVDEVNRASPGKKLILLSESALPGYQQHHDVFSCSQLEATSQTLLLEKEVDFQGCDVSLGSVVGEHCTHALTGGVVTELISPSAKLILGEKIPDNISYYIPRSLERSDYITAKIFNPNHQHEYFLISNVKEQDVTSLEDSYGVKLKKYDENQDQVPHHFYWTDNTFNADSFTGFCQKIPGKNVHWLSLDQNNLVYWNESFNNMDVINNNIDKSKKRTITAEDLKDVNERVVLVAAEPGMGKTTFVNNVAREAKSQDNSLYVVRVNLNNVTRHLKENTEQYFTDQENIADFLINVARTCDIDNEILRSRLTRTGNVNIYLDGYDEISPYYNDKVTNMIKSMKKLKVGRIYMTSRNVMRHHLESKHASICYSMKPFTDEDQISFLVKMWNAKHSIQIDDTSREFARNLLKKASESFSDKDREFTGIPLQCMMLGEVFAEDVKRGDLNLPNRLDLLQLFETFVSEKMNILNEGKDKKDTSNPREIAKRKREQKILMENHSDAAIILLLSNREIELLRLNKSKIASNVEESFSVGEEAWKGLVDGMTDGKPSFIHRCFAEYFLAWWLSENISSSTDFNAHKLFEPRFVIVRQFFDRLLARDCPLHNAVLSADREQVEALLTSGADVNQLDKEGRSALHLVVDYCDTDRDCDDSSVLNNALGFHDTAEASTMQLLLAYKAKVNLTDRILQGTPLRYADRSKTWGKVEHLLKNKANTDGLVELRELINTAKKIHYYFDQGDSTAGDDETERRIRDARGTCHSLVLRGCFHILQFAVDECGLQVNARLIYGLNSTTYLLHVAAESGREDSVKFLLDRGADMMLEDGIERLPIHDAAGAGSTNIMPLLIESINVKDWRQITPLHLAALSGHLDTVKWLVDAGAEVDSKDNDNDTPLHWAVRNKHVEVAKYLIETGANVNAKDSDDVTPLHRAAESGEINTVMLLLKERAQLNAKTKVHGRVIAGTWKTVGNETPLHWAMLEKHVEVAKYLILAGADVNAKSYNDVTPLHWAVENKHVEVAKYLIEAGADVNAKDSDDVTPLHRAAESGEINIVMLLLLKEGAQLNAKTKVHRRVIAGTWKKVGNETPLHWAILEKHVEVAKYLIEKGADQHCADSQGNTPADLAQDLSPEFIEWLSFRNNK